MGEPTEIGGVEHSLTMAVLLMLDMNGLTYEEKEEKETTLGYFIEHYEEQLKHGQLSVSDNAQNDDGELFSIRQDKVLSITEIIDRKLSSQTP